MALGSQIRKHRNARGLTLEQLSEASGVDVGTISALENRDSVRSQFAGKIAKAFGMTVEQMEDEEATPYQHTEATKERSKSAAPSDASVEIIVQAWGVLSASDKAEVLSDVLRRVSMVQAEIIAFNRSRGSSTSK